MDLLTTLVLGSYAWATLLAGWLWRQIRAVERNHYHHLRRWCALLEARLTRLEATSRREP